MLGYIIDHGQKSVNTAKINAMKQIIFFVIYTVILMETLEIKNKSFKWCYRRLITQLGKQFGIRTINLFDEAFTLQIKILNSEPFCPSMMVKLGDKTD